MAKTNGTSATTDSSSGPQKVEKWAAIAGRWKFSKGGAKYLGPDEGAAFPLGLARAAQRFRDGTIRTTVKLKRNTKTSAGVLIGYQSPNAPYTVAMIGGYDRAYVIADYLPDLGWIARATAGSLSNLSHEQNHHLEVRVFGQTIEMTVDEVDVLRHVLPHPIEGTGFGLYAFEDAEVEFTDTAVEGVTPKMFVIMPFSEPFDTLYREVILPVGEKAGFDVVRVDEITGPGIILDDIRQQIEKAHAVVAEISPHPQKPEVFNPNVFYELGYAHALGKPAVLLVRKSNGGAMPFDIRGYRAIFYDDSIGGKKTVETNLRQHLSAILRDS
jgi:hypothetical protein